MSKQLITKTGIYDKFRIQEIFQYIRGLFMCANKINLFENII